VTGRLRRGHALAPRTVAAGDGQLLTGATQGVAAGQGTIRWLAALIVVLAASGASPAEAQCRVRTESAVAFGTYSVFATAPLDTTGRISWRCQGATPVPVQITVSRGNHPSGTARRLAGSSDFLRYELYLNSDRTSV
jgi:spore coat protein U-like protein